MSVGQNSQSGDLMAAKIIKRPKDTSYNSDSNDMLERLNSCASMQAPTLVDLSLLNQFLRLMVLNH